MLIPVINLESGKATVVNSEEVLYFESDGNSVLVHTVDNVFRPAYILKDFAMLLKKEHYEALEKSNVVNLAKVVKYDEVSKQAYFDIERKGKHVNVSRRNLYKIDD